ncbi:MAG: quinolinate synthase NadA [Clostridia bacterium]|nr:quinolinate synthase NadA [Clostridia bacterium]
MPIREPIVLKEDIKQLKRETDTAVFAHNYMDPDIVEIADACGDGFDLAMAAANAPQKNILICGVRYIAETAAVMAPDKNIRLSHSQAGCPMTGRVSAARVEMFREQNPDVCIVVSINSSLQIKANADICVTPTNAVSVIRALSRDKILFLPDGSLGEYIAKMVPEKQIEVWPGGCPVLRSVERSDIELARRKWPNVPVAVSSRCRSEVTELADMIGSTNEIISFCEDSAHEVIICDEMAIHARMNEKYPEKFFKQLAPSKLICNSMRLTTLEIVERALKQEAGEQILVPFDLADAAREPIDAMIKLMSVKKRKRT